MRKKTDFEVYRKTTLPKNGGTKRQYSAPTLSQAKSRRADEPDELEKAPMKKQKNQQCK